MLLIFWYLGLVAAGDLLAYFVALFVEYEWGSYPSMIAFLLLYFVVLWVAQHQRRDRPASHTSIRHKRSPFEASSALL
jgi:hypothetical protein